MEPTRELISIVIPVFNEEAGVLPLKVKLLRLAELLSSEFTPEFVFVDDGSSDATVAVLYYHFNTGDIRFRVLEHGTNRGVGAAFRTGFRAARGSFVCTIDADCSYSPEGLRELLHALLQSGKDIAVASPYHPQGSVVGVPAWRLLLSRACSLLYRCMSPLKLYTYTSIFRAYRAEVIRQVKFRGDGFVSAAEILLEAGRLGFTVVEVPMVLRARAVGHSKMKIVRTINSHLKVLFSTAKDAQKQPVAAVRRTQSRTQEEFGD